MCFDEHGQADTVARKVEIAERSVRLLIERAGFDPSDIIVDPNILAVATGIEEHNEFAKAFIEATREIKRRCPGVKVSGGVSNLSLLVPRERAGPPRDAFRVPVPRDRGRARHGDRERGSARRLRGHPAGPARARRGRDLQPPARRDRAARPFAETVQGSALAKEEDLYVAGSARSRSVSRTRSCTASTGGSTEDTEEARAAVRPAARRDRGTVHGRDADRRRPVRRREDVPAAGRQERARDEEGRRLPRAVHGGREAACWSPRRDGARPGKVILCTVKGDVHDIGKNIVGVVLGCNNYEVDRSRRHGARPTSCWTPPSRKDATSSGARG